MENADGNQGWREENNFQFYIFNFQLTLSLFMLRILAADADHALACTVSSLEDETVLANAFDGGTNFHD